jgi:prepilin-type N-terminal cleavage/methylation domain-containing protein
MTIARHDHASDRSQRAGGFSLIEVLIALAIMGIIALGIVGVFSRSMILNASAFDYAGISAVARRQLEQLRAQPLGSANLAGGSYGPEVIADAQGEPAYEMEYTVENYYVTNWAGVQGTSTWNAAPDEADTNVKKITLTLRSLKEGLTGRREVTVTALAVGGGLG